MRIFLRVCMLVLAIGPADAIYAAGPQTSRQENLVTLNFDNVDIAVLADFISRITGKNFVLDDNVRGKVTVIAPAKVTPAQAWCIFESALQLKGFATVNAGPVIKIVPARDARAFAALTRSQAPAGECAQPIQAKPISTQ